MASYPLTNKAAKYARDVIKGKVDVCQLVKHACKRHLDDLEKSKKPSYPYKFDKEKCEKFLKFFQMMKHVKGEWAGTTIKLEPWQCFCFGVPFGWVQKSDGLRRYNEVFLLIPRKNAKSTGGAAVGLYLTVADGEPGAEVYSAAGSEKQAYEVFRPAWLMANNDDDLRNYFGVNLMGTRNNPGNIFSMKSGSRFETVIGKPGDGASPHGWIQDEYHEAKTSESYDTGKTGMGARTQPMMWVISTAGTNTAAPCYSLQKKFEKIISGKMVNDQVFAVIYTIDKEDDWTDFSTWKKANPNLGVSIKERFLKSQHRTAMQDPREQNTMKCKHLNVWSNAGDAWMNMVEWEKQAHDLDITEFEGAPVYIGLDLASKIDIAAKIYIFKREDEYFLFSKYWLPESRTYGEDMAHYAGWVHDGYMEATPGSRIDIEHIQDTIKQDAKDFDLSGSENGGGEVCNDPWNAQQLITNLLGEDIECVEIPQQVGYLSEPMKEIEAAIKAGKFWHDGNPVTYWMVGNIVCFVDNKDNIFPRKTAPENKIDGGVAMITAMARAMYDDGVCEGNDGSLIAIY